VQAHAHADGSLGERALCVDRRRDRVARVREPVVEDPDRGTKRERWWRRPESPQLLPTDADVEDARSARGCRA
jgi:hypothetical protein